MLLQSLISDSLLAPDRIDTIILHDRIPICILPIQVYFKFFGCLLIFCIVFRNVLLLLLLLLLLSFYGRDADGVCCNQALS